VPTQAVAALRRSLTLALAPIDPFELVLQGVGAFPSLLAPRVLWAGIQGPGLASLHSLRDTVAQACRDALCPPADDRFRPHVTLGRFRSPRLHPTPPALTSHAAWSGGVFTVHSVAAIASELLPAGPAYTHLSRFPLKSSATPADP
jgi:2'-5' RNA ligase